MIVNFQTQREKYPYKAGEFSLLQIDVGGSLNLVTKSIDPSAISSNPQSSTLCHEGTMHSHGWSNFLPMSARW